MGMDYGDVENVWKQRMGQKTADYESEIVALTLQAQAQIKQLEAENERLKNELVEARGEGNSEPTEAPTTP